VNFRLLIENTSDLIAVIGPDRTILYVSPSVERILGCAAEAVMGRRVRELAEPGAPLLEALERLRDKGIMEPESFRVRRPDGEWISLEVTAKRARDENGEELIIVNCRDASERVLLQQQLEQAERLASLGRLASTVSHEFNNVLMGIQPFLYVLQRHARNDEYVQNIVGKIETSVRRGKQITAQITRFMKADEPVLESIRISDWITELLPEIQGVLGNADIALDFSCDAVIAGDRKQLTQVIANLAANARDAFGSQRGRFVITCREEASRRFSFGVVDEPERYVHIVVSDSGSGIAPEVLPRIFEPLFSTKRERGTGLGLTVVHQIIEKHHGKIFVESSAGKGTTLHLFLPKALSRTVTAPTHSSERALPESVRRVLIVEDELSVAQGLAGLLTLHDLEVKLVDRITGAEEAIADFQPQVLILDVALPDGDGSELYRSLLKKNVRLPVVFSTAHENRERLADLLEQPQVAFLQKPYDEKALLEGLRTCVS
jgi:two-component system cell cycle sensor histidine kinase/response regulator CckA